MTSLPAARVLSPASLFLVLALLGVLMSPGVAYGQTQRQARGAPDVGETATQRIDLAAGPNLVGLSVYPEDLDIEALFADALDQIVLIKGSEGTVFAPGYGVYDLVTWRWDAAYLIYARKPVTVEVRGQRIDAASPLDLDAGWGWVPFLAPESMPVEEAFASLGDHLTRVEDIDGRMYPADGTAEALTTLRPGQGYRIHLAQADTLVYGAPAASAPVATPPATKPPAEKPGPSAPAPAPPERIVVASIAQALALQELEPGEVVEVEGYYTAGDGGGGTFEVTESGVAPDGGTVFVPDEFVSGVVTETHRYEKSEALRGVPQGQDLVYGTLAIDLLDSDGRRLVRLPGHHLHGHAYGRDSELSPGVLYEQGATDLYKNGILSRFGRTTDARYSYRTTTSDVRLEREWTGSTLNVAWFGARPSSSGANWTGSTDTQPIIAQAINVANALNQKQPGRVAIVQIPEARTYDYFGMILLPEGITLRGAGGTEVQTKTDEFGHVYRPVRVRSRHTRLKVMTGEAFRHIRMLKDSSDPSHLPADAKFVLDGRPTAIWVGSGVMRAGIEDLVLDGNWEGNQQAWTDGWATHSELETWGRNAPGHAGFVSTSHGGVRVPQGQRVRVRNVAIEGFISNGLLGNANNTWTVENARLGNSLWNHVLYNANGSYTNLTLHGFAWGHAAWGYGTIDNLVYEDASSAARRQPREVFQIRGGDSYDSSELTDDGYFVRSDGTVPAVSTTIRGFHVDLRGFDPESMFAGIGSNVTIRGVSEQEPGILITGDRYSSSGLYKESANGYQKALYRNNRFEHILVHDMTEGTPRGGPTVRGLFGNLNLTESAARDIRVERDGGGQGGRALTLRAARRNHPAWDRRQVQLYEDVHDGAAYHIAEVRVDDDDPAGMDVFIRRSSFDNTSIQPFQDDKSKSGTIEHFEEKGGDTSKMRVYMDDVTFNIGTQKYHHSEIFFALARFHNCTDRRSGLKSETRVTLRASDFDGNEAIVPLGLFWAPLDRSFVNLSGSGSSKVSSWDIVDSDGNPLGSDKRSPHVRVRLSGPLGSRTLVLDAAVRPWEDGVAVPASLQ